MVLATFNSGIYQLFLYLHILSAIIGFGGVMLNGAYAAQSRQRPGREGLAIFQANFFVTKIAEYAIYAVFVFGFITVLLSDKVWKFSQAWVSGAMGLYIVAIAISHAVMIPSTKKMEQLLIKLAAGPPPGAAGGGPPPEVAEVEALGKRMGLFGAILNVLVLVVLFLMIVKPGQ